MTSKQLFTARALFGRNWPELKRYLPKLEFKKLEIKKLKEEQKFADKVAFISMVVFGGIAFLVALVKLF